ncbi:MAG: hypothetical protein H8K03_05520 [Nitrospira sp.]|jgi:hypothetical protein|nr:hypothetical protein [Nitrospira sp. BO4]
MMLSEDNGRPIYPADLPVTQALRATHRSPSWKLFDGWRPRRKNRQAGLLGSGTRRGQALLKRLAQREGTNLARNH